MNKTAAKKASQNKFNQPFNLFWRLFLSMLTILLLTSALSVGIERWMNAKELNNKMQLQVARLLIARQNATAALANDDLQTIKHLYRDNRWLMSQMRIVDDKGELVLPKSRRFRSESNQRSHYRPATRSEFQHASLPSNDFNLQQPSRSPHHDSRLAPSFTDQPWEQVSADISNYPELEDTTVLSNSGKTYIVQLQPRLSLRDLMALRKDHTLIRVSLILLFSILVCYWLSRALTRRIQRVQGAVHLMSEGRFTAAEELQNLGNDELGMLAKDVSKLSTRLANSELARKQMLSDISHELRSPLARLDVATELTRDFAPEAGHYLDRIEKESVRMNELIEHIIQIQSLQMRQNTLDIEAHQSIDLYDLLDEIRQDVCFEFQDKGVSWQWQLLHEGGLIGSRGSLPADSHKIMGDPQQLHSAFENILRNAFTHTAADSSVTVSLETFTHPKQELPYLKVKVIDAGSGVAEADLQRIFQPFVRLSTSRERLNPTSNKPSDNNPQSSRPHKAAQKKYNGYGLGLAIAHAIIMVHQGELVAYNRQDGLSGLVIEASLPAHHT